MEVKVKCVKVEFVYSPFYDLVYHFLAYMHVDNASDLYSRPYIERIQTAKADRDDTLCREAARLGPYYNRNFERLGLLNFLPFYYPDFASLKNGLLTYGGFTQEDRDRFISPLLTCLERESAFFLSDWNQRYQAEEKGKRVLEAGLEYELGQYQCLFEYFHKSAVVGLSFSLTRNGRGLGSEHAFIAIIPYPDNAKDVKPSFFTVLHEYTHQFTDALLPVDIHMQDGSHALSEYAVILFDYYLIKAWKGPDLDAYLAWVSQRAGQEGVPMREADFLSIFRVPDSLNAKLMSLAEHIVCQ